MKETLREKALNEIRRRIIGFEIMPGERLSDKEFAAELGLGRTPVREALLILEREKLVQCKGKSGYFVNKLTKKEVDDYLSIREALEIYSVPMIIRNVTPLILSQLKQNLRKSALNAKKGLVHEIASYNDEFHDALYQATDSVTLVDIMSSLANKFHWLRSMVLTADEQSPQQGLADHQQILEALSRKSKKDLKRAFIEHLRHTKAKYLKIARLFPPA
jgi:GntR family transcriptional regulator, rspAB operon transcriptional repressor